MSDADVVIGIDADSLVFFLQQSFFFGMMMMIMVALILIQILFGIVTYWIIIIILVSYFLKRVSFAAALVSQRYVDIFGDVIFLMFLFNGTQAAFSYFSRNVVVCVDICS